MQQSILVFVNSLNNKPLRSMQRNS